MMKKTYSFSSNESLHFITVHFDDYQAFRAALRNLSFAKGSEKFEVIRYSSDEKELMLRIVVLSSEKDVRKMITALFENKGFVDSSNIVIKYISGVNPLILFKESHSKFQKIEILRLLQEKGFTEKDEIRDVLQRLGLKERQTFTKHDFHKRKEIFVIQEDGSISKFDSSVIMESLLKAGVKLPLSLKVSQELSELTKFVFGKFLSSREIAEFVVQRLNELDPSGDSSLRYSRFLGGGYLLIEGRALTRSQIKNMINKTIKKVGLTASRTQIGELSDDVFEALRRLSITSSGPYFEISRELLERIVHERVANLPLVSRLLSKTKAEIIRELLNSSKSSAKSCLLLIEQDVSTKLATKKLFEAIESVLQALLLKKGILPTGRVFSDASLIITKKIRLPNTNVRMYVRTVQKLEVSSQIEKNKMISILQMTEKISNSLL